MKCALIGGEALAVHGVARATVDADVLVPDADVLRGTFWNGFSSRAAVEIHHGEHDDPLAGVIRIRHRTEQADVIVLNTCTIREKPDARFAAHMGKAAKLKRERPGTVVAVGGCYAEAQRERRFGLYPGGDPAFGPGPISRQW